MRPAPRQPRRRRGVLSREGAAAPVRIAAVAAALVTAERAWRVGPVFRFPLREYSMNYRNPLLALAVLVVLSGGAYAANPPPPADPAAPDAGGGFARLDKNGDGVIDRSEAAANPRLAQRFDALDKNHDGKLTPDEFPRHGRPGERGGHGGMMAKLDTNKDGRISREEANADPKFAARFAEMDVNKDGFVDRADFELRAKQHRDAWFAKADTNKDGMLSRAEFDAAQSMWMHKPDGKPGRKHGPMPAPAAPDAN
jgi:Ca2+-binding EF-hand superfamily protein